MIQCVSLIVASEDLHLSLVPFWFTRTPTAGRNKIEAHVRCFHSQNFSTLPSGKTICSPGLRKGNIWLCTAAKVWRMLSGKADVARSNKALQFIRSKLRWIWACRNFLWKLSLFSLLDSVTNCSCCRSMCANLPTSGSASCAIFWMIWGKMMAKRCPETKCIWFPRFPTMSHW